VSSRVARGSGRPPDGGGSSGHDTSPLGRWPDALGFEAPRSISAYEYRQFQALVERESGIHLGPEKQDLLVNRLRRRLVELRLPSFSAYYHLVSSGDTDERIRMLDAISTNETSFFREAHQFAFLQETVFPRWASEERAGRRARRIRAWSAACSTGEEPYTLGMVLLDRFPPASGWTLEILASDISTRVLAAAALGSFPIEDTKEIPPSYLRRFMLRGRRLQQGRMSVTSALRDLVTFRRINLHAPAYPVQDHFDLILCRNVLMYFEPVARLRTANALLDLVAPGGYLFLGHAESLGGSSERGKHVGPATYAR
jgi:chemotaxis protein methyltransferase CheR